MVQTRRSAQPTSPVPPPWSPITEQGSPDSLPNDGDDGALHDEPPKQEIKIEHQHTDEVEPESIISVQGHLADTDPRRPKRKLFMMRVLLDDGSKSWIEEEQLFQADYTRGMVLSYWSGFPGGRFPESEKFEVQDRAFRIIRHSKGTAWGKKSPSGEVELLIQWLGHPPYGKIHETGDLTWEIEREFKNHSTRQLIMVEEYWASLGGRRKGLREVQ